MTSRKSVDASSDAQLDQDAMGAATSHEVQPSEETIDTTMADAIDMSDQSNQLTGKSSSEKTRLTRKRALEVEVEEVEEFNDHRDLDDEPDFKGALDSEQPDAPKKKRRARSLVREHEGQLVHIGQHAGEPRMDVGARLQDDGRLWMQALWKSGAPKPPNWDALIGPNRRVSNADLKLNPIVAPNYKDNLDDVSHEKKKQLVKDYLSSLTAQDDYTNTIQSSELPELVGNANNDGDKDSHSTKTFFEPPELHVGTYDDGAEVYVKCSQREKDKPPSLSFFARSLGPAPRFKAVDNLAMLEWIQFDKKYCRGSIDETKTYLKTFFKAKTEIKEDTPSRKVISKVLGRKPSDSVHPEVPLNDKIDPAFAALKDEIQSVLATALFNERIRPAITNVREEVALLEVQISVQENEIFDHKSNFAEQAGDLAKLATTNEQQAGRIAELESALQGRDQTIKGLTATNRQHVDSIAASEPLVRLRDQMVRELTAKQQQVETMAPPDLNVREHFSTLESQQSRIQEPEELGSANRPAMTDLHPGASPQDPLLDVVAMQSKIEKLEKALETEKTANQSQAQKLASLSPHAEDQKLSPAVMDLQIVNLEKDKQIKDLKEQVTNLQAAQQPSQPSAAGVSVPTFNIPKLNLAGQTFDDAYMRIPEDAAKVIMYLSNNSQIMVDNGKRYQRMETLQEGIFVGGESNGEDILIGGEPFSRLLEDGLEKYVQHLSPRSLVEHEGKIKIKQVFWKQLPIRF